MPKQPQDRKQKAVVTAAEKATGDGPFVYETEAGETITLPSINSLTGGMIRKHRRRDEVDFMFSLIEEIADEENLEKVDALSFREMNRLFTAWQEDGEDGATVPQS